MKPVPTEGRGSRLRGNDGLQATGMTGFRRVVQRFPSSPSEDSFLETKNATQ